MNIKKGIALFLMMSVGVYQHIHAQANGSLIKLNDRKYAVAYNLQKSKFDKEETVKAAMYTYKNYTWSVQDISLNKVDSFHYSGEISISDGSSLNAIRFYQGDFQYPDLIDINNGDGYFIPMSNITHGYYVGQLSLLNTPIHFEQGLGYYSDKDASLSINQTIDLLKKELSLAGTDTMKISDAYFKYIQLTDSANYKNIVKASLQKWILSPQITDNGLTDFYYLAKGDLQDPQLAMQIHDLDSVKFPTGVLNRMAFWGNRQSAKTLEETNQFNEEFLSKFPYSEWLKNPNGQEFIYYETFRNLAAGYFDTKQYSKFINLTKDLNFKMLNEIYRWNILRAQFFKTLGKDTVANLATIVMDNMITKVNDGSLMSNGFFPLTFANANAQKQLNERMETQILILNSVGRYSTAKKYYSYVVGNTAYDNANLNEAYCNTLTHLNELKELDTFLKKCIYADAMSPKMIEQFKALYSKSHKSQANFDAYYSSLKSPLTTEKLHKIVKSGITKMDFEPFALESGKGGLVRSSDWDGKIVVLDFWATWCRPCIESFPSMQMLVDKYAKDSNMKFYFVGTMQYDDYKQKDSTYINARGFRFDLLYDQINPTTKEQNLVFSQFAKMLNSSGIPRKLIIKDGIVRYTTEGFGGSASNLLEEMSYAIELLKNEDK